MLMKTHPIEQNIRLAVDAVIFTVEDRQLKVLLIKMKKKPFTGKWAFPGGLIDDNEKSEAAARRILEIQTGVKQAYLEHLSVFDDIKRDPFGRVVSAAYFALIPFEGVVLETTDKYADVRWQSIFELPKLAYDHQEVAKVALERLRERIEHSNIAWSLLPERFTLTELQAVYEAILDKPLDKRNFRKKMVASGLLKASRSKSIGQHRPAQLYRFIGVKKTLT